MSAQIAAHGLVPIAVTVVVSFILTGAATAYARRYGLVDQPGERHSHRHPTPRGGGAGLLGAILLLTPFFLPGEVPRLWTFCLAPCVLLLALVGWWDDHRSLSVRFRFTVQLAVSVYLLFWLSQAWAPGHVLAFGVALLFILWMTNLYNFMDGSNGMAGLQGVFAGALLAALFDAAGDRNLSVLALVVAAACAGFLPWNLGRARVFMGDVGSLALGFLIAAMLVYGVAVGAFSLPVGWLVMLLFLTDSTLTLAMRVMRGERWYNAHRQHLYQRLIARGWTHGRVALNYQAVNLLLVLPGVVVASNSPSLAWPVALGLTFVFALAWYLLYKKIGVVAQAG